MATTIKEEGNYEAVIQSAELIEPRFNDMPANAFEIHLPVKTDHGEEADVYLEISSRYGQGTKSSQTQAQISMDTLLSVGWQYGVEWSRISTLVGKRVPIYTKRSKTKPSIMNAYISTSDARIVPISPEEAVRRAQMMLGQPSLPPAPTQAPPVPANPFGGGGSATAGNPFAKG